MVKSRSFGGHSLLMNTLLAVLNFLSIGILIAGIYDRTSSVGIGCIIGGAILFVSTFLGLLFLKGKLVIATAGRVLAGGFLTFTAMVNLNDPVGYARQLSYYFQDEVIAYQLKNAFGWNSFSLEGGIPHALSIAIVIALLELCVGLYLVINAKIRGMGILSLFLVLFLTFLSGHALLSRPNVSYVDIDSYAIDSPIAQHKIQASKKDKRISVLSQNKTEVVISEQKTTPKYHQSHFFNDPFDPYFSNIENLHFWSLLIVVYFLSWIVSAQRWMFPNSIQQNWIILPLLFAFNLLLSWLLHWYYLSLFTILIYTVSLWIYRSGGKRFGNHYTALLLVLLGGLFLVNYTANHQPLKDFGAMRVGNDLRSFERMSKNGDNRINK